MMYNRWAKLIKDFYKPKKGHFDTTKVPDLYDNALYDMVHNRHLQLGSLPEVYGAALTLTLILTLTLTLTLPLPLTLTLTLTRPSASRRSPPSRASC